MLCERRYPVVFAFEPCAVVETSPGKFQVWLKHSGILSKELGTFAVQLLAERFGADPSAAEWRRFGRLAEPTETAQLTQVQVAVQPLCVAMPAQHPAAAAKSTVKLRDFGQVSGSPLPAPLIVNFTIGS